MTESIIIDNGHQTIKGGYSGTFEPSHVISSKIGRYKLTESYTQEYRGDKFSTAPEGTKITSIFNDSTFNNEIDWKGLESIYNYLLFQKLQINSKENTGFNYLIINKPNLKLKTKQKMLEIMFESMNSKGVYFGDSTTMGLYSYGKTTGICVDLGYESTNVSCIYEGYLMPINNLNSQFGGKTINNYFYQMLSERETNKFLINQSMIETIKKKHCYVSKDYFDELVINDDNSNVINYTLPDGNIIEIGNERFKCSELLFQPKLISGNTITDDNISLLIANSINKCYNKNLQKVMYENIVLIGGNSLLLGLKNRLYKGIAHLSPASANINIHTSPQRKYAAFTGGSLLAEQSMMENVWVTKQTVEEYGYKAISVRCF